MKTGWAAWMLAGMMIAAGQAAVAQRPGSGGHASGERRPAAPAAHQHYDARFGHDRFYYDRGYAVRRPPAGGLGEVRGRDGRRYWRHGGDWYRWDGRRWIVWGAPVGVIVPFLPWYYTTVWWNGMPYYYANDTYYVWDDSQDQYQVVAPPDGVEAGSTTQPPPSNELFAYPSNGQSSEQQSKDRAECQSWAAGQAGFDPAAADGGVAPDQQISRRNAYFRAQVSCLEGRGYTVR